MGQGAFIWGSTWKKDYVVDMKATTKPDAHCASERKVEGEPEVIDVAVKGKLILSVTENGYGKPRPPTNTA